MTFLQYVAKDILAKHPEGLSDIAVVFPNKRASLFLNQALYEEAGHALWSPSYITISDLFARHSQLRVPDQILLIFKLYNVFCELTGSNEPLDHFYSWGQLLLSDFDDIDKNMAEAEKLFVTLEAWESMKDTSFLSEKQKQSLEEFFNKMIDDTPLQQNFNAIWQNLAAIYARYRESLEAEGLAYEGMLYRKVVEQEDIDFQYKHYIFVGFNLLQKVEQKLFRRLKDEGRASFYWDYDVYFMDRKNEAGRYISQYLDIFPNQLSAQLISERLSHEDIYQGLSEKKDITYISAPTEDIQARYVSTWLKANDRYKDGSRTAVVLGDESLLQTVVHCLPKEISNVNITTGFPLASSPVSTLVTALFDLRLKGKVDRANKYRLKFVNRVLMHPYAKYISTDCQSCYKELNDHRRLYPSIADLTVDYDDGLQTLFADMPLTNGFLPLLSWVADILKRVGIGSREVSDPLLHESVFRMYTLINRLDDIMVIKSNAPVDSHDTVSASVPIDSQTGKQVVSVSILQRLMTQLVQSSSIPFHGEPAVGIQIMGVLETRNLDFDHVLMLSCNEGNIPKGVNDASFIPHSLRAGYELTTVENKVSIYAYYFYSLCQRAGDVTLTYNNATDEGRKGEMSRFMMQYMLEKPLDHPIRLMTLQSGQSAVGIHRQPVAKSGPVLDKLHSIERLSPSAINRYLRCPLQFFYNTICELREQDNDDEDEIDSKSFGNIFHRSAELIYSDLSGNCSKSITADAINNMLNDRSAVGRYVDQAFRELLFKVDDPTFRPQFNGLHLLHRKVIMLYLERLLRLDRALAPIDILSVEHSYYDNMTFDVDGKTHSLVIGGYIDRLDQVVRHGRKAIRVIDYKTGTPLTTLPADMSDVFDSQYVDSKHTAYYLQAMLYASIIRNNNKNTQDDRLADLPVIPALLFVRQASGTDYDPALAFGTPSNAVKVEDIAELQPTFMEGLQALLTEIFTPSIDFSPTSSPERCLTCPYRKICGLSPSL